MNKELINFYKENAGQSFVLSDEASKRVKDQIFSNLHTAVEATAPISFTQKLRTLILKSYILAPLVILLFISGTTYVSADAQPGDSLYPLKLTMEDVRVFVAPSEQAKLKLQERFAQKRLDELDKAEIEAETDIKANNETKIELDANEVSSHGKSEENIGRGRFHQEQARREAIKAVRELEQKHVELENVGQKEKAEQLGQKVNNLKERLENRNNDSDSGESEGPKVEGQSRIEMRSGLKMDN